MNKLILLSTMFLVCVLLLVGFASAAPPDTDNNGCVSLSEISAYVGRWLQGNITLGQVSSGVSWWLGGCINVSTTPSSTFVIGHTNTDVTSIPTSCINKAKSNLHIAYSHTSHGNQIFAGMAALRAHNSLYSFSATGGPGVLHFEDNYGGAFGTGLCADITKCEVEPDGVAGPTRQFLNSPEGQDINVIMWSWCAINSHNVPFYLDKMKQLIIEYENGNPQHPTPVKFIFMTGHTDSQGQGDSSDFADYNNRLIRTFINNQSANAFCKQHQCILFDFADIEERDPSGNDYAPLSIGENLAYNGGNWGIEYLQQHPTGLNADLSSYIYQNVNGDAYCSHSESPLGPNLNCALKGQAIWNMYSRMVGWDGNPSSACTN